VIKKEEILTRTTEIQIFEHFVAGCKTGKNISSPFSEDEKPSFRIYKPNSGEGKQYNYYTFKCNSTAKQGDCFQLVAYLKLLDCKKDFDKVLDIINNEMNLGLNGNAKHEFSVKHKDFSVNGLEFWKSLNVDSNLLELYNTYCVDSFAYDKDGELKKIKIYEGVLAFDYVVNNKHEVYIPKQILSNKKEIKKQFYKNQTKEDIFGLKQLSDGYDILTIVAGKKDCLVSISFGFPAVSFSTETIFPTAQQIRTLKAKCKTLAICYDNDKSGQEQASKIAQRYNLPIIKLPIEFNDIAEYLPKHRGEAYKQLQNISLNKHTQQSSNKVFEQDNAYYIKTKVKGSDETYDKVLTNFTLNVIALVNSESNPRRIVQIVSDIETTDPLEFSIDTFVSKNSFKREIAKHGNFYYFGNDNELTEISMVANLDSDITKEIIDLGYDRISDSYVLSNALISSGKIHTPDKYGIVYNNNQKGVYIPASSILNNEQIKFRDSQKFKLIKSQVTTEQWLHQFEKVYLDSSIIAIPFLMAAIHFDFIAKELNGFPLFMLYGPPRNGKSTLAASLLSVFGEAQEAVSLPNATQASISGKIAQFKNALGWFDEFDNSNKCGLWVTPTLKGFFDLQGRLRKSFSNDNATYSSLINSASIVTGQEAPSDDALLSRCIAHYIAKKTFSKVLADNLSDLNIMESQGLGNVLFDLFNFRPLIIKHFKTEYNGFLTKLNDILKDRGFNKVQPRLLKSYSALLSVFEIYINNGFPLFSSYSLNDILEIFVTQIISQIELEQTNDELIVFWETFDKLIDSGKLIDGVDFKIDKLKDVLTFKASSVFDAYAKFMFDRTRTWGVAKGSLQNYLKAESYLITNKGTTKFYINTFSKDLKASASYKVAYSQLPVKINDIYRASQVVEKPIPQAIQADLYQKN